MKTLKQLMVSSQIYASDGYFCGDCGRRNIDCICIDFEATPKIETNYNSTITIPPPNDPPKEPKRVEDFIEVNSLSLRSGRDICYMCGLIRDLVVIKSNKTKVCLECVDEHLVS